jgi:spectinomycin phosphotransferase
MIEKPNLNDDTVAACLHDEYGLHVSQISFLPLGADRNTAVYNIVSEDNESYFLRLRRGGFEAVSVSLPKFFSDQGIEQIIAPLTTTTGDLWTTLDAFTVILYPFVEGRNGYETRLSDRHWRELGAALRRIHTVSVPPELRCCIPVEAFCPDWREMLRSTLGRVRRGSFDEPLNGELAAFLRARRDTVLDLVVRAETLAQVLQREPAEWVLCHSDIHAGNVLLDDDGALYIVDWDDPIIAPKERDLMFIGGGQGFVGRTPQQEEVLFYEGYGQTQIDAAALAYYRYERIVQDIALFSEQILSTQRGNRDRMQALQYLMSNFLPKGTIEIAYRSDRTQDDG